MVKYKFEFNLKILGLFNKFTGTDKVKSRIMSIYAYILKYPEINTKDLYRLYMHNLKETKGYRYTKQTFNRNLRIIEDLSLIKRVRIGLKIFFVIVEYSTDVSAKFSAEKPTQDVDMTNVEQVDESHKYKTTSNIYNYNIYNTNGVVYSPQENDVVADKNSLLEIAEDLFKLCKIRSKFIKTDVIDAIVKMSGKIYRKSARQYILSIIADKRDKREKERSIWAFIGGMQKYNKCNVNTGYNFNDNSYSAICDYENSLIGGV